MHLVYLDEVKHNPPAEPFYWLCGLAFPEQAILDVDRRLCAIAGDYFDTAILSKATEFHAVDIVHGKGAYKRHDLHGRLTLYRALIDTIDECPDLKRIEICVAPARMRTPDHAGMALMFFVEKVNALMQSLGSIALLIADHDAEMVSDNVTSLSAWKQRGTDYQFGTAINFVVDTIHHTHSHHSRLIQLADVYTYTVALASKGDQPYAQGEIVNYARSKANFLFPSKYKFWPSEQSRPAP